MRASSVVLKNESESAVTLPDFRQDPAVLKLERKLEGERQNLATLEREAGTLREKAATAQEDSDRLETAWLGGRGDESEAAAAKEELDSLKSEIKRVNARAHFQREDITKLETALKEATTQAVENAARALRTALYSELHKAVTVLQQLDAVCGELNKINRHARNIFPDGRHGIREWTFSPLFDLDAAAHAARLEKVLAGFKKGDFGTINE